jgi:RNA polymerase sigma-70 factor, ECF subfamily
VLDEDTQLLEAWRAGDRRSGSALFERHFTSVRRFFRNKVPATETEDLVQRTFQALLEHQHQFRGEARFIAYVLAIARSQWHRWLRKHDPVREGIDGETVSLRDLGVSPSEFAVRREEQRVLLDALQRLPIDTQALLELFYWEGLDAHEIAIAMGMQHGAVRTRLTRARQALRGLVGDALAPSGDRELDDATRALGELVRA